jgi:polygalacturonase
MNEACLKRHIKFFHCGAIILSFIFGWTSICRGVPLPAINTNNIIIVTNAAYGAIGDGVFTNTTAIQSAINKATTGGNTNGLFGGTVEIPPGTFLCGPITFKNNVNLKIDTNAILRMLPFTNYPMTWFTNGTTVYFVVTANFISGNNLTNIEISGSGAIDGQGAPWWPWANTNGAVRPRMISWVGCNRELIQNVTLSNSPMFHISISSGANSVVQYVTERANSSSDPTNPGHNTDACDITGTNTLVQFNNVSVGDDNFTCAGPSSNILITNNVYGEGHGTSIGSYTSPSVSNYTVVNCTYSNTQAGAHIKTDRDRGGFVHNISYLNLTMTNALHPIQLYCQYTNKTLPSLDSITPAVAAAFPAAPVTATTPHYRDILISNFTGYAQSGRAAGLIWGLPESSVSNVTLVNVNLSGSKTFGIYDAKNVRIVDSIHRVPSGVSQYSFFDADVTFSNSAPSSNVVTLDGATTNSIANSFSFYNALMTLKSTNAIALNSSVTLGASTFIISNNLAMTPSNSFNFVLGSNAATVVVKGNLSLDGTNNIFAGGGFTNGTYTLFTYTGTLSGALPSLGSTPTDYGYSFNTNTIGQVNLIVEQNPPTITRIAPANATVIAGNGTNITINADGWPALFYFWYDNSNHLIQASTSQTLTLANLQLPSAGVYSVTASNFLGTASTNFIINVAVPPVITSQPTNQTVNLGSPASFSVTASGVPAPNYQWYKNSFAISDATNATYFISSVALTDAGIYNVVVSNIAGSVTSSNAVLVVNIPTMAIVTLSPGNDATGICYDTPLFATFNQPPTIGSGTIRIYNITNSVTPVDTIAVSSSAPQPRNIGGDTSDNFLVYPVIVTSNTAEIYPHEGVMTSNQIYYVLIDSGVILDTNGANFTGFVSSNAWQFATKPTGPADRTNVVVSADGSGDFETVQGAIDSVPMGNTTPTTINVCNGFYRELVNVYSRNNLLFRGQSRGGTQMGYPNNNNINPNTHTRMAVKVSANDISFDNLTITNMTSRNPSEVQAEALMIESGASREIFNNCDIDGFQDTILANQVNSRAYFKNCLVQGDVDFIWGGGNLFFTNCEIRYLTRPGGGASFGPNPSPSSSDINSNGFSFVSCAFTTQFGANPNDVIGRTRGITNANMAMINCLVSTNIGGWYSDAAPTNNFRNWYYNCTNDFGASANLSNGIPLAFTDVNLTNAGSATIWLYGWQPKLSPNIISQPVGQTVNYGSNATFTVVATGVPDPTYQWQLNSTNLSGANSATLTISSATPADDGSYTVIIANSAGSVTSSAAALTVNASALPSNIPTNIVARLFGNQLQLSWPQDHLGWRLEVQTNSVNSGIGTNWVTVPDSTNVTTTNITVDPANGSVFLRLVYP